jgi:hypothetical protein
MLSCHIIRDLLPGYIDGVVSEETAQEVSRHLDECAECHALYEQMESPIESSTEGDERELDYLKKIKRKSRRLIIRNSLIAAASILVILAGLAYVFVIGRPAKFEDVDYMAGINVDGINPGTWVVHLELTNGKAIALRNTYTYDDDNHRITGAIIKVLETPKTKLVHESTRYTFGYSHEPSEEGQSPEYDQTITIVFKDKELTYSMRDEGLYEQG